MESEVREMLNARASDVAPSPAVSTETLRRVGRRRIVNAGVAVVTAVGLVAAGVVVVDAVRPRSQELTALEGSIRPLNRTVIDVGGAPQELTIGFGSVWAERQDEIVRVDATTNEVVAHIVAANPFTGRGVRIRYYFGTRGLTTDGRSVWATGTGFTDTIEPPTAPPEPPTIAPDPSSAYVWSLLRIDPQTNTWVAAMPAYVGSIKGSLPSSAVSLNDSVWVAAEGQDLNAGGALYRIDTNTEEATSINFDGPVTGVVPLDGFLWATVDVNRRGTRHVAKIDPTTGRVVQTVPIPDAIVLQGIAVSGGSLWVPAIKESSGVEIVRIDASTGTITMQVRVAGPVQKIVGGEKAIWFSVQDKTRLYRLDPATNTVDGDLAVGGETEAFAVDGSTVWASVDPDTGGGPKPARLVRFDI